MIIRVFRARVQEGKREEFERFFLNKALPMIKSRKGLISVSVGTPVASTPDEFVMIMVWQDIDSLRLFAGAEWENAVIDPDEGHLIKETFVHHYEVAVLPE
jgi:heme-degrading monooxygenase HmoA